MTNNSLMESYLPIASFWEKQVTCRSQAHRYLHISAHISGGLTQSPHDFISLTFYLF